MRPDMIALYRTHKGDKSIVQTFHAEQIKKAVELMERYQALNNGFFYYLSDIMETYCTYCGYNHSADQIDVVITDQKVVYVCKHSGVVLKEQNSYEYV